MTARLTPVRQDAAAELQAALAELEDARSTERALRALVAERKAGASSLATAQWRVQRALRRLDNLGWRERGPEAAA